jgi:hypothetical protein
MEDTKQATAPKDIERVAQPAQLVTGDEELQRFDERQKKLTWVRSMLVAQTLPGDWKAFGETLYLEGDGALRIAPLVGLTITNKSWTKEVGEDGVVSVTYTADFFSRLFNFGVPSVSRTRTDHDDFLTQNGKNVPANLDDVVGAAEKGCIARGVQLVAGLSGITPEEMMARFGLDVKAGAVGFKTGAKTADKQASAGDLEEAKRILHKISRGEASVAGDILGEITHDKTGKFPDRREPEKLTAGMWAWVMPRLRDLEKKHDAAEAKLNAGGK